MTDTITEYGHRELTRALALTIAYKAAVDDEARNAVVAAMAEALTNATEAISKSGPASVWLHGSPARSWDQVATYFNGDPHDRSKVQVLVGGRFHDLVLGADDPKRPWHG